MLGLWLLPASAKAAGTVTLTGTVTYGDGSKVTYGEVVAQPFPFPTDETPNPATTISNGKYSISLPTGTNYSLWANSYKDISDGYENTVTIYFPDMVSSGTLNFILYRCKSCFHWSGRVTYDPTAAVTQPFDRLGQWTLPAGAINTTTRLRARFGHNLRASVSSRIIDGTTLEVKTVDDVSIGKLNAPLHLALPIALKRLGIFNLKSTDVQLAEYNPTKKKWTPLKTTIIKSYPSSANQGVTYTANVDHFGTFALISKKAIRHNFISVTPSTPKGTLRVQGRDGQQLAVFSPYGKTYRGTFHVATGDLDGNNSNEIITLQDKTTNPVLKVFNINGKLLARRTILIKNRGKPSSLSIKDVYANGSNDIIISWDSSSSEKLTYSLFPNELYDSSDSIPDSHISPNIFGE